MEGVEGKIPYLILITIAPGTQRVRMAAGRLPECFLVENTKEIKCFRGWWVQQNLSNYYYEVRGGWVRDWSKPSYVIKEWSVP